MKTITGQKEFTRAERVEYGTLRDVSKEVQKLYKWKGASIAFASAKNLKNEGAQLMLSITEVDATKDINSLGERTVWVSREVGDMLRAKQIPLSATLDLIVIEHTNKDANGNITSDPYPLCVRPTKSEDGTREKLRAAGVDINSEVSFSWENAAEEVNIDDFIA